MSNSSTPESNVDEEEFHEVMSMSGLKFCIQRRYEYKERLGAGAQGAVFVAYDHVLDKTVAIKKLSKPFQHVLNAKRAYRELCILKRLDKHENIIGFLNAFTPQKRMDELADVYLVMDLMESSLCPVIKMGLDNEMISFFMYQILSGLKHLHAAGIIHRDLKPSNIAVRSDCTLKILDFGLACVEACSSNEKYDMTGYVVTRYYRSPEVIFGMGYDKSVDVWSAGCIFGEMLQQSVVFAGQWNQWNNIVQRLGTPSEQFLSRLGPRQRNYVEHQPRCKGESMEQLFPDAFFRGETHQPQLTADSARDLLSKMLVIDPLQRISVDDALKHPYVSLWHDEDNDNDAFEAEKQEASIYDHSIDLCEHSLDKWKELVFDELNKCE